MNKIHFIKFLVLIVLVAIFQSCLNSSDDEGIEIKMSDAQIYSFSAKGKHLKDDNVDSLTRARDSIAYVVLGKTKFAIDQNKKIIFNPDSLPYGMNLRKFYVTMSFNPTYGANSIKVKLKDSTYTWNSTDSIDFSKGEVKFEVTAADGSTKREYTVDIRIHQIDPDRIEWKSAGTVPTGGGQTKTLLNNSNSKFYCFEKRSADIKLFTSTDGASWSESSTSGLPADADISSIALLNGNFYAITSAGQTYTSLNGITWNTVNNGKQIAVIYGIIPDNTSTTDYLLVAIKDGSNYQIAKTQDFSIFGGVTSVPNNFPMSGFAVASDIDRSSRRMAIVGGKNQNGTDLNSVWLVANNGDGVSVSPYTDKQKYFAGEGLAAIVYKNKVENVLINAVYVLSNNRFYTSTDWGGNWSEAPQQQVLPEGLNSVGYQNLIVDNENNIWIFGGKTETGAYSTQVWKGKLNSLLGY
ncbi:MULTISPECIES: DUF6242 domain-containing protein [unclassified Dysgonomonas]|uniref:DUF6242 domain-containing protein n=1 Tax=unclassified Dysgonomonas TaxID=2630389 RepID=UPI0024741F6A|nr:MULTISPECIES: DUF6242 domain-containing protein [unclassified Dysgonomonas]